MTAVPPAPAAPSAPSPTPLADRIGAVLRSAAAREVMPRFRHLRAGEVEEKAPGDLVTIADREAERVIAEGLAAIRPDARFVGEEACAREPERLNALDRGAAWIVDPIDGTGNYAAGREPFALMAALIEDGVTQAACILDPVADRLIVAERGRGTWREGVRVAADDAGAGAAVEPATLTGIVSDFSRPPAMAARVAVLAERIGAVVPTRRCAGYEYPLVAAGTRDFALYWRTLAWDHAPGVLLLEEAGGVAARIDGSPYRPADASAPILIARSPAVWATVAAILNG